MNILAASRALLMSVSAGTVWDLAAHVLARHLYFEESPVRTHAQLVAQPVPGTELVPAGGAGQAGRADHHGPI